jgi:hypothetical protein
MGCAVLGLLRTLMAKALPTVTTTTVHKQRTDVVYIPRMGLYSTGDLEFL